MPDVKIRPTRRAANVAAPDGSPRQGRGRRDMFRRDPQSGRGGGDGRDRLDHAPTREERWQGELAATERKKSGPKGPRLHSGGGDGRDRLDHVSHTFWYDLIWDPCGLNAFHCFR